MHIDRAIVSTVTGLVVSAMGCNQLAGIREGSPRGDGGSEFAFECSVIEDCKADEPQCRAVTGCEQGRCVFDDAIEGTPLAEQISGDCVEVVCDGFGRAKIRVTLTDAPDDKNPCTLDT